MNRRSVVLVLLVVVAACKPKERPVAATAPGSGSATTTTGDQVAAFWTWFGANAAALHGDEPEQAMNKITDELVKVDRGVIAEIALDGDTRTLVVSADGKRDSFPAVEKIVAAKPAAPIAGWKVVAFRQRSNGELPVLESDGTKISLASTRFVATPAGDKLDLTVFVPGPGMDDDTRAQFGFLVLDHTIGEYDMETRIAGIDFAPIEKAPAAAKPIAELPAMVDALKK